ncbi:mechanosensitive ion channel family protein [bacterium]|nr:mechanosensitive ion channel family protein [bacterium]
MRWLLWLLLLLMPVWVQAQPPTATPVNITETASPVPATNDGPMSSPKRTLETFLAVMAQANPLRPDLEAQARECMDLSRLNPLTRTDKGSLLAYKLNSVLQTMKSLPPLNGPSPVTLLSHPEGTLQLALDPDGNWRFTPDSVDAIDNLFEALHKTPEVVSSPWQNVVLGAPAWKWTSLGLWFFLGVIFERIVSHLVGKFVTRSQQRLGGAVNPGQAGRAHTATGRLTAVIWWTLGLTLLQPPMEFQLVALLLLRLMAFYFCLVASFRWLDLASAYFIAQQTPNASGTDREMFVPLLRRTCKTFVALLLLSMLGRSLNLDITGLLAGFSILGAMVALAGQDTVKNIFGSLTVLVDRSFQVGDRISVQGVDGVVEDLGFRSTRIRTAEDTLVTLPNSLLLTCSVDNWGRRTGRRFATGVTVDYGSTPENIEKFCQMVSESLAHQAAPTRAVSVTASALNDFGIRLTVSLMIETYDSTLEAQVRHAAIMEILRSARECDLQLVYPSHRVVMQKIEDDDAVTSG